MVKKGGGIKNLDSAAEIIEQGAEKVVLNSHALLNPELIRNWSNSFAQDSFKNRFEKTIIRAWRDHINSCDIATSDLSSSSRNS